MRGHHLREQIEDTVEYEPPAEVWLFIYVLVQPLDIFSKAETHKCFFVSAVIFPPLGLIKPFQDLTGYNYICSAIKSQHKDVSLSYWKVWSHRSDGINLFGIWSLEMTVGKRFKLPLEGAACNIWFLFIYSFYSVCRPTQSRPITCYFIYKKESCQVFP